MNFKFLILGTSIFTLSSFTPIQNKLDFTVITNVKNVELKQYEKYRVTAKTKNSFGENFWVDLIVEGSVSDILGNSIYKVYYDDGYGLKSLSYYTDYDYENSYYVYIDYEKYYFTF